MDKLNNAIKPIEEFISTGISDRFYQVFGFPILFTNSPNKKTAFESLVRKSNPNAKLPYAFASFTSLGITEQGYSPRTLLRRGLIGGATHDRVQAYRLPLIPVDTQYQLTVLLTSPDEAVKFARQWLFASQKKTLNCTVTYGIADLDIAIEMDTEVQIPQRTGGVDEPEEVEVLTNFRVKGYASEGLERAQVALETEVEGQVGTPATTQAGNKTTQFFKFNRPWDNK